MNSNNNNNKSGSKNSASFGANFAVKNSSACDPLLHDNVNLRRGTKKGHYEDDDDDYHQQQQHSPPRNQTADQLAGAEDDDSNSSSRTLESSQDSATLTSSDTDDPNWKGGSGGHRRRGRPLSESISMDKQPAGSNSSSSSVRLRSHSHPHQLRGQQNRTSADVYMMTGEDSAKMNTARYSASPKQYVPPSNQQYGPPYYGPADSLASLYAAAQGVYTGGGHHLEKTGATLSSLPNYHMMQPSAAYHHQQQQQQRSNYANFCRLGCDCLSGGYMTGPPLPQPLPPCHSSALLYEPHLGLANQPYWDCSAASLSNSMILASASLANHPYFTSSPAQVHHQPLGALRKSANNNNSSSSNSININNNNNSSPANSGHHQSVESVDKLAQVSQSDKSNANSAPDFYHHHNHHHQQSTELTDALGEQDRNSNFLHQVSLNNEPPHYHDNSSQVDRIGQLESIVAILRNQLLTTEDLFKKALLSKKSLEGANCDLLTVVDKLKLDLVHSESRRKLTEDHNMRMEADLEALRNRMLEKDTEISSLRLTLAKIVRSTGYNLTENELALLRGKTIASDFIKNKLNKQEQIYSDGQMCKSPGLVNKQNINAAFYSEPSSRRESVSSTLCSGRASPASAVRPFHSAHPSPSSTPPSRPLYARNAMHPSAEQFTAPAASTAAAAGAPMPRSTSAENMKMTSEQCSPSSLTAGDGDNSPCRARSEDKQPFKYGKSMYSTLPHNARVIRQIQREIEESGRREDLLLESHRRPRYGNDEMRQMSQSLMDEQLGGKAFSTPSSPLATFKSSMHTTNGHPPTATTAVTFGKTFFWLRRNKRATSAPELAKDDEIIPPSLQSSTSELARNGIAPPRIILTDSKPKGLKKIFSRKRSTSSLSGLSDAFSRGGLRATSGPRLGFTNNDKKFQNITLPFSQWDTTLVADWFAGIGLGMYVSECKRWVKNGEHLMRATAAEVEKDLGIRNLLHRKKLRLAVAAMNDEEDQLLKNAGKLDYLWVARWLDDIGLPQYKDAFLDARIDGRVLHYLTVEDLFFLKVTSQLHFASIRSGIRILRENNYNGQCLKRRSTPEEAPENEWSASEVAVWSSHRVMEFLRSIDLSEYAPNLRGAGVHGALILFENAFNADLFATLLNIPISKTLLRRHISAKFKQLIGDELSKIKRDFECQPNYSPMIPGSKVKAYKKGHFTLRKKRSDFELTDYVCPMTPVLSTRNKIINLINDAKSSPQANEQLYQNMNSSGEWKNLRRQNPSTASASGSGPIDFAPKESSSSSAASMSSSNKKEETHSVDRSPSSDMTTKSDSDLNEVCTNDKPIKKESVIS